MFLYPSVQIPMEVYLYSTLFSFFFKVQKFGYFFINELEFWLNLFSTVSIIEFIIFSRVILIFVFFFYLKKKSVLKG